MQKKRRIEYTPAGPTLQRFHMDNNRFRFIMGPVSSGKTTAMVWEIFKRCQEQERDETGLRRSKWLVIRASYRELDSTTIPSWRSIFGDEFGRFKWSAPPTHFLKFGDIRAEIIFFAADDPDGVDKLRGMNVTAAWLNEVNEIPRAILTMTTSRIGRFPTPDTCTWSGIMGDTNPPDPNHWYADLSKKQIKGWSFYEQPPAVLWANGQWVVNPAREGVMSENWYRDQLDASTEEEIKVFLAGQYGFMLKGRAVYGNEYNDSFHCVEIEPDPRHPIAIGSDWGLDPAAIIGQKINGQIRWIDEVVCHDMGAKRFVVHLKEYLNENYAGYTINGLWGDPKGSDRSTTDDTETYFKIMKAGGLPFKPAPVAGNSVIIRIESVAHPLSQIKNGVPVMVISPRCKIARAGLSGGYIFRKYKIAGEEKYNPKPDKDPIYSHVIDGGQYLNCGYGMGQSVILDIKKRIKQQATCEMEKPYGT